MTCLIYPKNHFCFDETNKKVIVKFKDETNASPIREFTGLRSKLYCVYTEDEHLKSVAKGVKKCKIALLKMPDSFIKNARL
jgi:hypothetical protein